MTAWTWRSEAAGRMLIMVLAGGLSSRMGGGDKTLRPLGGGVILDRVLARLAGQASRIVISANGDASRFARFGLTVLADTMPGHKGPLAGILAGMEWALAETGTGKELVSVPADCPFLPDDLVTRLAQAKDAAQATMAIAASQGRAHPVVALWPASLAGALRRTLEEGAYRVQSFTGRQAAALAEFEGDPDPFLNINTEAELASAEAMLQAGAPAQPC